MAYEKKQVLILAKTYPSPSAGHVETSCVAGITDQGEAIRIYPVPFRLLSEDVQFKKWQWIEAQFQKANRDHRRESYKIGVDSIELLKEVPTSNRWQKRLEWSDRLPQYSSLEEIKSAWEHHDTSLAILHPHRIDELIIEKAKSADWTEEEKEKLLQAQKQGDLFGDKDDEKRLGTTLRKIPYSFYYRFNQDEKIKIVDWEIGALYWNCIRRYGNRWESKFREKLEQDLLQKDLMIMVGNIHRFPHQWLGISLIYPPKRTDDQPAQTPLF